jgi:PRTRC genetic system protein B
MENISEKFREVYVPEHLLVFYQDSRNQDAPYYVESFALDDQGQPLAPHPLTLTEAGELAKQLGAGQERAQGFLNPRGLLPDNLLHLSQGIEPTAVWHTPEMRTPLLFKPELGLESGTASVPPLLWKATPKKLTIFALNGRKRPNADTTLYRAPFFNIYEDAAVCMGNVQVRFPPDTSLEDFIARWQQYFFNSYFSHMLGGQSPVTVNIIDLWKKLVGTGKPFPMKVLKPTNLTLKNILR